jgi:hypothetical protein
MTGGYVGSHVMQWQAEAYNLAHFLIQPQPGSIAASVPQAKADMQLYGDSELDSMRRSGDPRQIRNYLSSVYGGDGSNEVRSYDGYRQRVAQYQQAMKTWPLHVPQPDAPLLPSSVYNALKHGAR